LRLFFHVSPQPAASRQSLKSIFPEIMERLPEYSAVNCRYPHRPWVDPLLLVEEDL
jgi:hypothetical protein